jgi:NhaP-type Na+/H+ or K+/H+ antiporter
VVILTRPVFLFTTYYWSRLVRRLVHVRLRRYRRARVARMVWGRADPKLSWQQLVVISWTGMRGVVTLAAAVSIPLVTTSGREVPARDTMFLIAFVVTVGTLLLQGLTLPSVIRWLGVQDLGQAERDVRSELRLVSDSTQEAIDYLDTRRDEWSREWGAEPVERSITILKERLRRQDEAFRQGLREDADEREGQTDDLHPAPVDRGSPRRAAPRLAIPDQTPGPRLLGAGRNNVRALASIRRELLQKRRELVLSERDAGNLDEEVMRRVLLGLDAEELAMDTSAVSRTRS